MSCDLVHINFNRVTLYIIFIPKKKKNDKVHDYNCKPIFQSAFLIKEKNKLLTI